METIRTSTLAQFSVALAIWMLTPFSAGADRHEPPRLSPHARLLVTISEQLASIESRMSDIESQLTTLDHDLRPCTIERYRAGLCGEGNTPFDLVVTLCGAVGGEAELAGSYAIAAEVGAQIGAGWKDGPDADIHIGATIPPLPLPSEISAGVAGSAGISVEGCIEGVTIPIGANVDPARVDALLTQLELGAADLQAALMDAIDLPEPNGRGLDVRVIADALQARKTFAATDFQHEDPLQVFRSPVVTDLATALPIGGRVATLLQDPGVMMPDMGEGQPAVLLCDRLESVSSLSSNRLVNDVCAFVEDLPELNAVIMDIENAILSIPTVISGIVQGIFNDVEPDPVLEPGHPFCQRFPILCIFQ